MAAVNRYTGTDLVVTFTPDGGSPLILSKGYTSFTLEAETDMADATAGNEKHRYYKPTISDASWSISFYADDADSTTYADIKDGTEGVLRVQRLGLGAGKPLEEFDAIIASYSITVPFDNMVEIEISGKRQGEPLEDLGALGEPEINVQGNSVSIVNGDATPSASDHTEFAGTTVGNPVSRTFTIQNTGVSTLTLGTVTVPAGFTVTTQPAATVAPAGSTTVVIQCSAGSAATFSGNVSIPNNDTDENPYVFAISCAVS